MDRGKIVFLLLFGYALWAHAVTHLHINNTSHYTIKTVPAKIVLSCDAASLGNTLACEVFVDINGNFRIDSFDARIQYLNLVDGLGWIYDGEMTENGIPGDETGKDGFIRSTLEFGEHLRPYSPQTWIIRMTDENHSTAEALLSWELPFSPGRVTGTVRDAETNESLPHVLVHCRDAYFPEIERLAITDESGKFIIQLANGDWQVSTSHPKNKEYRSSQKLVKVNDERNLNLDVRVNKYDAFIEGRVIFENDSPVENVTVALQNRETLEIFYIRTDQNGLFKMGVEAGHYVVTTSQYYSRYLGNHYWPDGFYAEPAVDTLEVTDGQNFEENITFRPYPVTIRGACSVDGKPLADVLVQGIAVDPNTKRQQLYQTFSKSDGSYALGVFPKEIKSVVAQKEGFIAAPLAGFHNINIKEEQAARDYHFSFTEQLGLMKLSGSVYGTGNRPLAEVHVVAYNIWDNSPDGHLITKTNANGHYYFDIKVEGDWQVGVFKEGAQVRPELYYKYMSPGLKYKNLNFVVSAESDMQTGNGQLLLSDFNLLPHLPDPFFKETVIDFVLPKSSHTQVELLSLDGHELATLLDHDLSSGYQKLRWDGTDETGNIVDSGVYLCRIKARQNTTVLPITLLR